MARSDPDDYDILCKVVLIGDSGVGKTQVLNRFCRNEFNLNSRSTIGVEFATKTIKIEREIWDTAGQERYRAITNAYYRGAVGALVVYDITSRRSFDNIFKWLEELRQHSSSDIVVVLVGNKSDLQLQRAVQPGEAQVLAEQEGMFFLETSAKEGSNVAEAFHRVVEQIYEVMNRNRLGSSQQEQAPTLPAGAHTISITPAPPEPPRQAGCCS